MAIVKSLPLPAGLHPLLLCSFVRKASPPKGSSTSEQLPKPPEPSVSVPATIRDISEGNRHKHCLYYFGFFSLFLVLIGVLVKVPVALMKHYDQKQGKEEMVYSAYTSIVSASSMGAKTGLCTQTEPGSRNLCTDDLGGMLLTGFVTTVYTACLIKGFRTPRESTTHNELALPD